MRGKPVREAVDAFVLAGGQSLRMGRDKARLDLDGVPLAVALARRLAPGVRQVWLVVKPESGLEDLGVPLVYDSTARRALVHGLQAALEAPGPEWRFVVACDMPAVGPEVLAWLWHAAQAAAAPGSAPRLPGRPAPEPVPSLWHRAIATRVRPDWGLAARDWVRRAGLVDWVVPRAQAARLAQCNTPQEWAAWLGQREEQGNP